MSESDLLCRMLQAWREDIESVPFPQFSELTIPLQKTRADVDAARRAAAPVTNHHRRADGGW
ncbi:hypothetical protein [Amycolatopsis jejuensis]|uniref:hypothetical protein n=1 Tax=Amycolatopsis jejuensis TaxID=330084 RepID=UPI0005275B7B|nr:hypothetical protein [Amycolatopsis jejuensis]